MIQRFMNIFLVILWTTLGINYLVRWESPEPWLAAVYVFLLAFHNLIQWVEYKMDER